MTNTLGDRIRELRDENDVSLRELARKAGGISAAFLSDIELGRRYPSEEVLAKLADALKVTVGDLRSYDSRPPIKDLKALAENNPAYGLALRKVIDKGITAEQLMKLVEQKAGQKKKE
jgi:transcriptional regulator with XRE-family HTH domain